MSVTGQQVIDRINDIFDDSGNGKWTAARKLAFVNAAIDAAWELGLKDIKVDSSKTLASSTFEYTPTATPELEEGFANAYVVPISTTVEPKVRLHRVFQRLNGTTWTIVVPGDITRTFNDKVMHLEYNARVARITAATDSIELPLDYLWKYATYMACIAAIGAGATFNAKPFEGLLPVMLKESAESALTHRRGLITRLPMSYDLGNFAATTINWNEGRYSA